MAPGVAAGPGAQRLVGTVLVLVCASALLSVVGADVADGPVGPLWWAVPVQAVVVLALLDAGRAALRGGSPDRAAGAVFAVTVTALVTGVLLHHAHLAAAPPRATPAWPYHLVVIGVTGAAVRWRRWPTGRALPALVVLVAGLAWLRAQPPARTVEAGLPVVEDAAFLLALVLTLFGALSAVEEVSVRLRSARADADAAAAEAGELAAAEAERARWEAVVHDDVLSALTAASRAATPAQRAAAAGAAAVALRRVATDRWGPPAPVAEVVPRLAAAADRARTGTPAHVDTGSGHLPGPVADALVEATAELVRNVSRHAGAGARASVTGWVDAAGVRVEVRDDGSGFAPGAVPGSRLGLRVSVVERLRSVGGTADVTSAPGAGTLVVLAWPA